MNKRPLLSIVVPFFNEEDNLEWHHERMSTYLRTLPVAYEFIYVNDGSSDKSLSLVQHLAKKDDTVRYLSFSRNFGKEAATTAGLAAAKGDAAVIIDADGQHPIEIVGTFVNEWKKGYATVIGVRTEDGESRRLKRVGSHAFYFILRTLGSDNSTQHGLTDFRLIDRKVINEFNRLSEHNRVTRNLLDWLGFSRKLVPFEAAERHAGASTYSFRKLFTLAVDGVVKHSTKPLKLISVIGLIISFSAALLGLFIIVEQYILQDPLNLYFTGSAQLAIFLSFLVGIVLFCQGLLALYIENVYYESQNRPLYIIEEEG